MTKMNAHPRSAARKRAIKAAKILKAAAAKRRNVKSIRILEAARAKRAKSAHFKALWARRRAERAAANAIRTKIIASVNDMRLQGRPLDEPMDFTASDDDEDAG